MYTTPETRTAQRQETYTKLSSLFNELDQASDDTMKNTIKHEIRKLSSDSGIQKISFPKQHKTDDDLKVLKERIRKKLSK